MAWFALLAQAGPAAPAAGDGPGPFAFLPFILIAIAFYFILLRPQSRQQREQQLLLASLKKGDKVETYSGILGTIAALKENEDELTLRFDDGNTRIQVRKTAIARVVPPPSEKKDGAG
jgi:preprotein translocase subunit YajC